MYVQSDNKIADINNNSKKSILVHLRCMKGKYKDFRNINEELTITIIIFK